MYRSETRSRSVSWGFAAGSRVWLGPSPNAFAGCQPLGEVPCAVPKSKSSTVSCRFVYTKLVGVHTFRSGVGVPAHQQEGASSTATTGVSAPTGFFRRFTARLQPGLAHQAELAVISAADS